MLLVAVGVFSLITGVMLAASASRSGVRRRVPMLDFICLASGVVGAVALYFDLYAVVAAIFLAQSALGLIITRLRWVWLKEKKLPVTVNTLFCSSLKP